MHGGIFGMNQPTITCPHCEAEITLTESLADPLIRATRKKIAEKEAEVARRESAIGAKRAELAKAVESIEQQFTTRTRDRAREDCGRGGSATRASPKFRLGSLGDVRFAPDCVAKQF